MNDLVLAEFDRGVVMKLEFSSEVDPPVGHVGPEEIELIKQVRYRESPPRLPEQPLFYPFR